jgi:hypothetical protein
MIKAIVATRETSRRAEFAGSMWVRLQYLLGLQQLGIETYWMDRIETVDPFAQAHSLEYLMRRFDRIVKDWGFEGRACVDYAHGTRFFGMAKKDLRRVIQETDLLINLGGPLPADSPLLDIPRRVYVDVDPGYTQIWAQQCDIGLDRHNFFFTIGQNVGRPEFPIPTGGIDWRPTLPPVCLHYWPARIDERSRRISTVADWRGSQVAIYEAEYYGTKREQFIRFLNVPLQAGERIDLVLCIGQHDFEDLGLLLGHSWRVRDPYQYAGDLESYREFIQYSRAEFSVAKSGYVKSRSGWISDRTACYLASGKPAITQSTGFEWRLPMGKGLLSFSTPEEAVRAIQSMNEDYTGHCRAARQLAEAYFDSNVVLQSMLKQVDLWPLPTTPRSTAGAPGVGSRSCQHAADREVSTAAVAAAVGQTLAEEEQVS